MTRRLIPIAIGRIQHVVPRNDPGDAAVLFNKDSGVYAQLARNLIHVVVNTNDRKTFVHNLAHRSLEQIAVIENLRKQMVFSQ